MNKINLSFGGINPLIDLIFPRLCFNCNELLSPTEKIICVSCKASLPVLDHKASVENYMDKFLDINPATVFCFLAFRKDNITQKLLHEFKYSGFKNIGLILGQWFGEYIKEIEVKKDYNYIIPIPLHQKKLRNRGFNQSEIIAGSIAKILDIPLHKRLIERVYESKTQTVKSRTERMFNVQGLFKVKNERDIIGKHILIVDDVITTGSTLASCALELLNAGASQISFASLALAK